MQTTSVMVQSLCVLCENRCRYCLLSWDGHVVGAPWDRSIAFARRFIAGAREACPHVRCTFTFGCAMEHPNLREALTFLREVNSPQEKFLQMDGMRLRDEAECAALADMLKGEGVEELNFTFYGLRDDHDRFAGRRGDFDGMTRMVDAALSAGLGVSAGAPLTKENVSDVPALIETLRGHGLERVRLFVPHEEGRGRSLSPVRIDRRDFEGLPGACRRLLNREVYRTEAEWLKDPGPCETKRALLLSLTPENIARCEDMTAAALIAELEDLDEKYYAAFPPVEALMAMYGDEKSERLYSRRDLFHIYRRRYAADHGISVYDVTDERYSGSRRY